MLVTNKETIRTPELAKRTAYSGPTNRSPFACVQTKLSLPPRGSATFSPFNITCSPISALTGTDTFQTNTELIFLVVLEEDVEEVFGADVELAETEMILERPGVIWLVAAQSDSPSVSTPSTVRAVDCPRSGTSTSSYSILSTSAPKLFLRITLSPPLFKKLLVCKSTNNQPCTPTLPEIFLHVEVVFRLSQIIEPAISTGTSDVLYNSTHSFPSSGSETNSFIFIADISIC